MFWFKTQDEHSRRYKPNLASPADVDKAFEIDSPFLKWLAEVITGDSRLAEQCLTDARALTKQTSDVFSDWLVQWARGATIQCAVAHIGPEMVSASHRYAQVRCLHGGHAPLALEDVDALLQLHPQEIVAELDPFARAVLLLRSVQRCTMQDCALRLATVRSAVAGACCALDRWFHLRAGRSSSAIGDSPTVQDIAAPVMEPVPIHLYGG